MNAPLRLWLVEDDPAFRQPFERFAQAEPAFDLRGSFESFEALAQACDDGRPPPDLLVLDLHLPGLSGPDAVRAARARLPRAPILVLTTSDDAPTVYGALRAGASGYVVKGTPPDRLRTALLDLHDGGRYLSPSVARYVLGEPPGPSPLTPRETEIVTLLSRGLTQAQIADALFISEHTVKSHLANVYGKLHARSAAEAVGTAYRDGLLPPTAAAADGEMA